MSDHHEHTVRETAITLASLEQVLVDLTSANTRALLSHAAEDLLQPHRCAEAAAVLARLQQLNPATAGHFRLKVDALAAIPLRMVCSPRPDFVPSFIAVSYCWHYPEWPISQHAQPIAPGWRISQPMVHAVMGHRQNPDEGIWMDQLCINQDDAEEKITHIGAMNIIYRSARRVLVLLEDVQLTADEASSGLVYSGFYADLSRQVEERNLEGSARAEFIESYFPQQVHLLQLGSNRHLVLAVRSFALKMLGARWYSRAWCAHESRTAPHCKVNNPLFLCYAHDGTVLSFEFRFILYLAYYLCKSEPPEVLTGEALATSLRSPDPMTLRHRWWRMTRLLPERDNSSSPMQHLVSVLSFGCQKKGDLVSIALNTWEIPLLYDGEINTVEHAILVFSLLTIASGDLTPLTMSGSKLSLNNGGTNNQIVSWLVHPLHGVLDSRMAITLPDSITGVTPEYIELDLLVFTSLPRDATPDSFQKAATLIELHSLLDLHRDLTATADGVVQQTVQNISTAMAELQPKRQDLLQTFHQRWLALALDCGLDWILRFGDIMKGESWGDWAYGGMGARADSRLIAAAYSLLALFDMHKDTVSHPPGYVDKAVRFLTCVLDPRLVFFTTSPRRLPLGPGPFDSAIIPTVSNRSWVAVPTAVAHLPSWQERAWIVEPWDQDGNTEALGPLLTSDFEDSRVQRGDWATSWQLKRRERIFGCDLLPYTLLTGSEEQLILLKQQRVYGGQDYDWGAATEDH
ncbi:hypothetical protein CONLIGDRAFT_672521 [Coniochaeta ligniaria NRRL 30616]|uniref:Heterokaryon incompatibility domain-containing protein n=1 Tax=Coniochaeta ligniaria NRRL 30616 TaxID=1408157 RepID=A0A1J7II25_9PEZI|nr:hypothetical protein CONLIGDRAFT_672521 [Coniochaeta ligniaria NRRL 30616]